MQTNAANDPRGVSIRRSLLINIVGIVVLLSATVVLAVWLGSQRTIRMVAESLLGEKLELTEAELRSFFSPVGNHLLEAAAWGSAGLIDLDEPGELEALFKPIMKRCDWVNAAMMADAEGREYFIQRDGIRWKSRIMDPGTLGQDRARWAEWAEDAPSKVTREDEFEYDPRTRPWYQGAIGDLNNPLNVDWVFWTRPYTLTTHKRPGITASVAFRSTSGVEQVVAFDLLLYDIQEFTAGIGSKDETRAFIVTQDEQVLGLPRAEDHDVSELEKLLLKKADDVGMPLVADAVSALLPQADTQRAIEFLSEDQAWWGEAQVFPAPSGAEEDPVYMMVIVPETTLFAGVRRQLLWITLLTLFVAGLVVAWTVRLSRAFSQPIRQLVAEGERLSRGDLDTAEDIRSSLTEIRRLDDALQDMRDSLGTLLRVERSLQRVRSEAIQDLSQVEGYEVAAWGYNADSNDKSTPGRAVPHQTASVWDHTLLPDRQGAVLLLADATGEGLESAFMATQTRSMVRMAARLNPDVQAAAGVINEQLHLELPKGHFVAAWLGKIEAGSGTMVSCSAGLTPLLHYRAARGACETLTPESMPLGVFSDARLETGEPVKMEPGDVFAVLSDAVFSQAGSEGATFDPQTACNTLSLVSSEPASAIVEALRQRIEACHGTTPGFDCSMIVVKRV